MKNTSNSLLLEPLCAKSPCRLQLCVSMEQLGENWFWATVQLPGTLVAPCSMECCPVTLRRGQSARGHCCHSVSPPAGPGGKEGLWATWSKLPPESRREGEQLSLQISLSAGVVFWLSFTLPKCSVPNSRPALCEDEGAKVRFSYASLNSYII